MEMLMGDSLFIQWSTGAPVGAACYGLGANAQAIGLHPIHRVARAISQTSTRAKVTSEWTDGTWPANSHLFNISAYACTHSPLWTAPKIRDQSFHLTSSWLAFSPGLEVPKTADYVAAVLTKKITSPHTPSKKRYIYFDTIQLSSVPAQ